jgi:tetratricopeptide (TPR) repeat protein
VLNEKPTSFQDQHPTLKTKIFVNSTLHPKNKTRNRDSRLSPAWHLNLAQVYAAKGELEKTAEQIETAYAADPNLKDGYARIGWSIFWPQKDYAKTIEWMEKDLPTENTDHVSGTGSLPASHRSSAPTANANIPSPLPTRGITVSGVAASERDSARAANQHNPPSRLSPGMMLNLAVACSATGDMSRAESLVAAAYAADPNLKDGYSRCGWQAFWEKKDYAKVIEWIEKDLAPPSACA